MGWTMEWTSDWTSDRTSDWVLTGPRHMEHWVVIRQEHANFDADPVAQVV